MNYFYTIVLLFGILNRTRSFDESGITLPPVLIPDVENESGFEFFSVRISRNPEFYAEITDADAKGKEELSFEEMSELSKFAKNISHSKGGYQESIKDGNEREVRRSILKKAKIVSESQRMATTLHLLDLADKKLGLLLEENKLGLLEDLEDSVHEYDVAVNFAKKGGLQKMIPFLFSPDDKIVSAAALVLGAATQSNPDVQKIAMIQDVGENLVKLLSHPSPTVVSRIIFALSSFLRNSPEAQLQFLSSSGVYKLAAILKNPRITKDIKLKIVNLFHDLAVEQKTGEHYQKQTSIKDVSRLPKLFSKELLKYGVCKHISSFLSFEGYDTHQKIISAMLSLEWACHEEFTNEETKNRLEKLLKFYDPASKDDHQNTYDDEDEGLKLFMYNDVKELIKQISEHSSNAADRYSLKSEL